MNKSFFRTFFSLVAILLLCVALCACGGKSEEATLVEAVSQPTGAVSGEPVKRSASEIKLDTTEVTTQPRAMDSVETAPDPVLDYILNTNSKRFHYPDCPSVDQMNEENKQPFTGTREEAIAKGYQSCGNCNP